MTTKARGRARPPVSADQRTHVVTSILPVPTDGDRRRAALRRFLEQHELTPKALGNMTGRANGNAIYNFFHGRSDTLSTITLERICACFPGTTIDTLLGRLPQDDHQVEFAATAIDGIFQDRRRFGATGRTPFAVDAELSLANRDLFAVLVGDFEASPQSVFPPRSVLICRPVGAEDNPPSGSQLVVHRTRGFKVEVTIATLVVHDGQAWLRWPSDHPALPHACLAPVPLTSSVEQGRRTYITVSGVVLWSWRPEPAAGTA